MSTPTFAKTHILIAYIAKPTKSEGFEQIIEFLNGISVSYALTATLTIRTLCINALVPKQPLGMNLVALWHQQSFVLLQIRSLTSQ
nr:hypothetical protein [Tanacetum cinerariifolium]